MTTQIALPEAYLQRIVTSIISTTPAETVYVFGSYARGENQPDSDLDIYVVTSASDAQRFEIMGRIGAALLWMDMPKDVLVGSTERFLARKDNLADIEYVVAREGVKVYDRAA